ncbi:MAG: Acyl carrier protein [Firmicutes bacterium ADurb.Bin354]|jgi:acyl carrier protein|nr:MAG: Acyl carrier protein [Firmicutes bacterium ADurb.Bin354]SCX83902.1 acyl carrier protein [Lachnospiraceae bacterium XPB1003]
MFEKIVNILVELTENSVSPEDISRDTKLVSDLDLTSLDVVNAVVMFEDEFDVQIPDDKIADLETVGDIEEYLKELIG